MVALKAWGAHMNHEVTINREPAATGYGVVYVVSCSQRCDLGDSARQSTYGQAEGRKSGHVHAMNKS